MQCNHLYRFFMAFLSGINHFLQKNTAIQYLILWITLQQKINFLSQCDFHDGFKVWLLISVILGNQNAIIRYPGALWASPGATDMRWMVFKSHLFIFVSGLVLISILGDMPKRLNEYQSSPLYFSGICYNTVTNEIKVKHGKKTLYISTLHSSAKTYRM